MAKYILIYFTLKSNCLFILCGLKYIQFILKETIIQKFYHGDISLSISFNNRSFIII